MALDSKNPVTSIYECGFSNDEDRLAVIDTLASEIDEENIITNKIAVTQLIEGLGEREKQVILLRYYKGRTQTQVAKMLGVTQVQISRIEKKVLASMKRKLTDDTYLKIGAK